MIKLQLEGFDELLKEIEKAKGNAQKATEKCMRESANIMQSELKAQMNKADVDAGLSERMPPYKVESNHGEVTATVGWEKGAYNPKEPSDAYKVIFINYGTPKRTKHGKVRARGFIQKAKKTASKKIKKQQEETLKEILKGLQG